jgi:hypothetical protein
LGAEHVLLKSAADAVSRLGSGCELSKELNVSVGDIERLLREGELGPGGFHRTVNDEPSVFDEKV